MLNINQNFDLKAPVFNFDRDYFNSVEELKDYDTNNVPDHFVTNVGGMLYQFTNGKWVPILSTEPSDEDDQWTLYLGKRGESSCYINGDSTGADCFVAEYSSNQSVIDSMHTSIYNSDDNKLISLSINEAYGIDESNGDSTVNMYLIDGDYRTDLNAKNGFKHKTDDGFVTKLDGYGLKTEDATGRNLSTSNTDIRLNDAKYQTQIRIYSDADNNYLSIGSDEKFKLSRPTNDEGGIISGIKSLTAFTDPSATKVWATDGSTVDLTTYTNYFNGTTTADKLKSKAIEVTDDTNSVTVSPTGITATNDSTGNFKMSTDGEIIDNEYYTGGPVDMCLTSSEGFSARINAHAGFIHTNDEGMVSVLSGNGLYTHFPYKNRNWNTDLTPAAITMYFNDATAMQISTGNGEEIYMTLGSDEETRFKISRPLDNSEGATITGVKSIVAFSDPSSTKVFATDGSIVDLSTKANASDLDAKANASDVLLKKSASGGYYIEENSKDLGQKAFAANDGCTASGKQSFAEGFGKATGSISHAEGEYTNANGYASHAEGSYTVASGTSSHAEGESSQATQPSAHAEGYHTLAKTVGSHAEGYYTMSKGLYSHAEGHYTETNSFAAHVQGTYNVANKNAIYSVGIGNTTTRKNAEYIYAKNTENSNSLVDDPKNGYKYLIGIGGYDGISTDNTTYKSVQEVIADLTARIEQLETKVKALEAANTPA